MLSWEWLTVSKAAEVLPDETEESMHVPLEVVGDLYWHGLKER